jgi:hypothetical protein
MVVGKLVGWNPGKLGFRGPRIAWCWFMGGLHHHEGVDIRKAAHDGIILGYQWEKTTNSMLKNVRALYVHYA